MSEDLKVEYLLLRIRNKLNDDNIKLWLPPYHIKETPEREGEDSEELEELANKYSNDLKIDKKICIHALKALQKRALEKLHDKEIFEETGVAVIKVKLSGGSSTNNNNTSPTSGRILSIHISLKSFMDALQKAISEQIDVPPERIKLIFSGKVLNSNMTLESQALKHGVQIMAVILTTNSSDLQEYEKRVELLERMKDDVKLLANSIRPEEENYLQVADQSGKTLQLPPEEQKALITAMALHEKGRAALKKEEYALALVFLLEADKEFSNCNSQLLNSVDNYALLNLDIAWCYLCLKNVTQLPDAEGRLKVCESKFKYTYGPNLERLVALKGSSGNEAALLMRLHLLQGIVLFHQNKHDEARRVLKEVQVELSALKVDDSSLSSLIELGMSPAEARLALRATRGCVNSAVEYIQRRRLEKENIIKREREDREKRKLGYCKDGKQYVDPSLVKNLESMGFSRLMAVEALRHSNNELNDAINVIHQQPELLIPRLPSVPSLNNLPDNFDASLFRELIKQVAAMGYDPTIAQQALRNHNGDLEKAVDELVANEGIIPVSVQDNDGGAGGSNDNQMPSSSTANPVRGLIDFGKRLKKEKEAFDRFSEDINTNEDDHLDLPLEQEEEFLTQYLSLLM